MENIPLTISIFLRFIMTAAAHSTRFPQSTKKRRQSESSEQCSTSLIQYEKQEEMCGKEREFMKIEDELESCELE